MTIEDVAEHAGFSTDYFNRIFLAHTGFNVMEYIRVTRLKKAARLLCGSDQDVLGIALDCGCRFYLGSDAHHPAELDAAPARFTAIVDALGLTEDVRFDPFAG